MINNHISRKLRHRLFFQSIAVNKNNIVIRTRGAQKESFLTLSQEVFGYFSHIIVLLCIKMVRKFIHQCKMQRGIKLFLMKGGFENICVLLGVTGI